jgi:hypothetical protein
MRSGAPPSGQRRHHGRRLIAVVVQALPPERPQGHGAAWASLLPLERETCADPSPVLRREGRDRRPRRPLRRRMLRASSAVTATPLDRQSTSIDSRRRGAPPRATPLTRPGHERAERGPAWNPAARSSPAISVEAVFKVDAYTREDSPNEVSLTGGAIGPPTGLAEQPRFQLGVLDDQHRIVA